MKNLKHYLSLASLLSVGFGLFWYFNYSRLAQLSVTIAMAVAYVFWGIAHHLIKKDLDFRIILEYAAVAVLASTLVIFLLLRS